MSNQTTKHATDNRFSQSVSGFATALSMRFQRILKDLEDRRQVRQLYTLSERDLKDMGLTRHDINRELMKPIRWW